MALAPEPRSYTTKSLASPTKKAQVTKATTAGQPSLTQTLQSIMTGGKIDQTMLANQAARLTNQSLNPQIAAYQQLQQQALAQAAQQANQIGLASQAAENFTSGLGDKTAQDYTNALAQQQGIAQGYSDQFRQGAEAQGEGLPPSVAAAAQGRGQGLGDLLYGLSGSLPADALQVQGLGATAAARALPATTLAYGQQQAVGALGAGREAAARFTPELAKVIASRPQVLQDILSGLQKTAGDTRQTNIENAFKFLGLQQDQQKVNEPVIRTFGDGGLYQYDPATGKTTTLREPTSAGPNIQSFGSGGLMRVNPDGSFQVLRQPDKSSSSVATEVIKDSSGQWLIDSATGRKISRVGGPDAGSTPSISSTTVGSATTGYATATRNPKTGQVEITPFPGRLGKPFAGAGGGYKISASTMGAARKVAELAFNGGKAGSALSSFLGEGGAVDSAPYETALKRVRASLLAAGVPRRRANAAATQLLIQVGYTPPGPTINKIGQGIADFFSPLGG